MNRNNDERLVRKHRIYIRLNDEELQLLEQYRQQTRAPNNAQANIEAVIPILKGAAKEPLFSRSFEEKNNERKERSKEKEETTKELCLVDLAIDDASRDATNAKKNLSLDARKNAFWQRLVPFIRNGIYTREMVTAFYRYWTEINENGRLMRFEQEKFYELPKRLATWRQREVARNYGGAESRNYGGVESLTSEQLQEQMLNKRRREEATEELLRQFDDAQANAVSYKDFKTGCLLP